MLCVCYISIYLSIYVVYGHLADGIQGLDGTMRLRVHTSDIDRYIERYRSMHVLFVSVCLSISI